MAYCLDYAVYYWGVSVDHELDKVSHKPSKEERKATEARQRRLTQLLALDNTKKSDPVSYTHLDVYKRQHGNSARVRLPANKKSKLSRFIRAD